MSPVAPVVRVPHQLMGAPLGSDVKLECQIESHPVPSTLWLKAGRPLHMDGSVVGAGRTRGDTQRGGGGGTDRVQRETDGPQRDDQRHGETDYRDEKQRRDIYMD